MGWVGTSQEMLHGTGDGELDFEAEIEDAIFMKERERVELLISPTQMLTSPWLL